LWTLDETLSLQRFQYLKLVLHEKIKFKYTAPLCVIVNVSLEKRPWLYFKYDVAFTWFYNSSPVASEKQFGTKDFKIWSKHCCAGLPRLKRSVIFNPNILLKPEAALQNLQIILQMVIQVMMAAIVP
jgi:hypothetical protein